MKRFFLIALFFVALTACAPALTPVLERGNGAVVVSVDAARPVYDVQLVVLNAVTGDFRCEAFGSDLVCLLGDVVPSGEVLVVVEGALGEVSCVAYGFLRADLALSSYRPFTCVVR